ncbi:MAG TPA: tetratricopeptide repeat protein [Gammaproteobacteria bacterium]|nr:tetratricopeptide repeat protein [Gammaproteobacteria bacterium]
MKKAMRAMAEGDLMEADIFLEAIENTAHLNVKAAGWVSWARGYLAEQAADFAGAYKHYSRAAQFMPHNPDLEVYTGWLAFNMGDYKNSMTHYEAALANRMRRYGEHDPVVAADLRNLGAVAAYLEDYREMYEYYERALLIDLQAYGESRPEVAVDRSNVGRALSYMKEYGKAIPHFEQALALNLKHYGKDAPAILDDYERLGDAWGELADYGKSAMYYKLALNSALKIRGAGHLDVARYQNQLGWLQSKLGDYKNAITYYEQALLAYRKHYPEDEPKVIEIKSNLRNLRKFCEKAGCLPL